MTPQEKKRIGLVIAGVVVGGNLIGAFFVSLHSGDWNHVTSLLVVFAIIAFIAWRQRESFERQRRQYLDRFEATHQNVELGDAALFSLTWSREIYRNIPHDRKQLVKQSAILIGIGLGVELLSVGYENFLVVLLTGLLVFSGVNLLLWVATTERSQKDQLAFELEAARKIQFSLMPSAPPAIPGLEIAGRCIPALNVGGDMFDYLATADADPAIAVADVAGKGMDAAMTAIFTSGALVAEMNHESDPARVMEALNAAIRSRNMRQRFVSLLLAVWNAGERRLVMVNAGQSRPLRWRRGAVEMLMQEGAHFPLGIVEAPGYAAHSVPCEEGDVLLFHTDGVSEAMNATREVYGDERIQTALAELCAGGASTQTILESLLQRINTHAGAAEQHDDITLVVVRIGSAGQETAGTAT